MATPEQNVKTFTNEVGTPLTIRIVFEGDPYKLACLLTNSESDPVIEFYHRKSCDRSSCVARYPMSTLFRPNAIGWVFGSGECGISLWHDEGEWVIDAATCVTITKWVQGILTAKLKPRR